MNFIQKGDCYDISKGHCQKKYRKALSGLGNFSDFQKIIAKNTFQVIFKHFRLSFKLFGRVPTIFSNSGKFRERHAKEKVP